MGAAWKSPLPLFFNRPLQRAMNWDAWAGRSTMHPIEPTIQNTAAGALGFSINRQFTGANMTQNAMAVLRVNTSEETTCYREAVRAVLEDIQQNHGHTLIGISEAIDISLGTVSNAFNKKDSLSPTFLLRLANCFGPSILDPIMALGGGRVVPLEPAEDDPLPYLCALVYAISKSRAGGKAPTHTDKLAMVPDLKAAQAAITNLLLQAERILSQ